jgi:F-type H+-transporting ATPase subunit b
MKEILDSLTINGQYFVFALINFLIAALAFYFIALKPLGKTIKERREKIDKGLVNAEEMENRLEELEKKVNDQLTKAQSDAKEIINEAKKESHKLKEEKAKESKEEAHQMILSAREKMESDKRKLDEETKQEIENQVKIVLKNILKEDVSLNKKIIDKVIGEIK